MSDPDQDLIVVGSFNSRAEAELAKSALDAAGMDALVIADDAGGMRPAMLVGGGAAVVVNRADEGAAREILSSTAKPTE